MATNKHPRIKADVRKRQALMEEKKEKAYRLYLSGHGVCEIAKIMNTDHSRISVYIKEALEDQREANKELGNEVKALELKRLDTLMPSYYEKALEGDTEALYAMLKIMDRRAKYMGLDSPTEIKTEIHQKAYVGMSLTEWDQVKTIA